MDTVNLWWARDYDPETDEAPAGHPEHDCTGENPDQEEEE